MRSLFVGLALALLPLAATAETYPARPVRIIVPSVAGDAGDILARAVGAKLAEALGGQFVVENKPGAGGSIGSEAAAKAAPDGYTLIMAHAGSHSINAALYAKLPYHPIRDFAPITLVARAPNILVVNPKLPVTSVAELIALAKAQPGKLNFASGGNGSSAHLGAELFKLMAGIDMVHVPYRGSSPALADLVTGEAAVMIVNMPPALPLVQAGNLRALAVTTASRSPIMPDLPTIAEAALPGFETVAWFGLLAPAGTPPATVTLLHDATVRIVRSPDMRERLTGLGAEAVGNTPEEFTAVMANDIEKWTKVVKASGAKID